MLTDHIIQLDEYPSLPVIGGPQVPELTQPLKDKEVFKIGSDVTVKALHTPCHTQDSFCYYVEDEASGERAVFTGDTLFIAGVYIQCSRTM